jgi:signal peptidase I
LIISDTEYHMNSSSSSSSPSTSSSSNASSGSGSVGIKETITSLLIAFMLAFLFRGFVVEGFQIPTGSMAPTLLGKHVRFTSPSNGYDWTTGPWRYADSRNSVPVRNQTDMQLNDPMSGLALSETNRRLAAGDRVFVLKYLPFMHQPQRWDVVVFKNPGTHENYIKRLVGLPGEQIAIVDGDIFAREFVEGESLTSGWDAWQGEGWQIARKDERTQRAMFQDVFHSRYVPATNEPGYRSPFTGVGTGWDGVLSSSAYTFSGSDTASLVWNGARDITDANAYNQTSRGYNLFAKSDSTGRLRPFPVSDVALSLDIEMGDGSSSVETSVILEARGREFRASVDGASGVVGLSMRAPVGDQEMSDWIELSTGSVKSFAPGEIHNLEFWHADQRLWLFVDGELVCGGDEDSSYDLTPAQRAVAATGRSVEELEEDRSSGDGVNSSGVLALTKIYRKPTFRWEFSGGPFTLYNVQVKRDIAYQNNVNNPTRGGHPDNFSTLSGDEFFMCGDNSERSADSRLWRNNEINQWVKERINDRPGVVHRDLIVGKAFVVYFPALLDDGPILAPDIGRMRWIW